MKKTLYIFLFLFAFASQAQTNLCPNPSFETFSSCGQYISMATGWKNCGETPDYFNSCSNPSPFGVPSNAIGYQFAATGNAYADLWTYSPTFLYRELIGISLTSPMIIGRTYYVAFKCSPGTLNGYSLQTNKLGLRFSTVAYDSINTPPINNFAHIYTNSIISDTTNWTTISGYVTADSAYSFLAIGNFFDDANTDTLSLCNGCSNFGVYYIDDVEVSDTTTSINKINKEDEISVFYKDDAIYFISNNNIENIQLVNIVGQTISSTKEVNSNRTEIPTKEISKGVYIAIIQSKNNYKTIKLLIN